MRTSLGKALVFFSNEQIEGHDKIGNMRLIIAKPQNPNDFSIETGVVHTINDVQKFFSPGDHVLVDYSIYQQGKFKDRVKSKTRFYSKTPDGELYWVFDGSDGWNLTEIFGKYRVEDGKYTFDMLPQKILIEPKAADTMAVGNGGILYTKKDDRAHPFWANVVSSNHDEVKTGMRIYCQGDLAMTIKIKDGTEYAIIDEKYILAYQL